MKRLACAALMLLACRGGRAGGHRDREELARVNGEVIFVDELKQTINLQHLSLGRLDDDDGHDIGLVEPELTHQQKQRMLDSMIDRRLLLQEAARRHVIVPQEEANRVFGRIKDDYPAERFDQLLDERKLGPDVLKKLLRDRLTISKLLRDEVYARIPLTDADTQAYFKAHPELAKVEEKVRCAQIVQKSEAEAKKVKQQIDKGMPFEEAASRYSIAPEANKGGDLGSFARGIMPKVIEEECFSLPVGKVSEVIVSEDGEPVPEDETDTSLTHLYHLFKVVQKKPAETLPFDRARELVESKLRGERQELAEHAFLATLRQTGSISTNEARLDDLK